MNHIDHLRAGIRDLEMRIAYTYEGFNEARSEYYAELALYGDAGFRCPCETQIAEDVADIMTLTDALVQLGHSPCDKPRRAELDGALTDGYLPF